MVDASIEKQAKAKVPQPALPPRPTGKVVTATVKKQVTRNVPVVKQVKMKIGFLTTMIPRIAVERRTETVDVQVHRPLDASPSEINAWSNSVAEAQKNYQAELDATINTLVQEQKAKERDENIEAAIKATKEAVVPLIGAITGLLGAIKALRNGSEEKRVKPKIGRKPKTVAS